MPRIQSYILFFFFLAGLPFFVYAQSDTDRDLIKCMTPHTLLYDENPDQVDPAIRKVIESRVEVTDTTHVHYSESGKFRIEYVTEGESAVPEQDATGSGIPDYVEWTAEFADYAYRVQVEELGFVDPTVHQGQECGNRVGNWEQQPITIYLRDMLFYGEFRQSQPFAFYVHNNFDGFPPNTDPEGHVRGALRVTVAHEFKHVIQYATNCFVGEATSSPWIEMDATMMENIVFPQVNDYYNYITGTFGIFGGPGKSTPVAYDHVTWMLYYAEYFGMAFWVDTWNEIKTDHLIRMDHAMSNVFPGSGVMNKTELFRKHKARNYLWHAVSGSRTTPGYGFNESLAYPDAHIKKTFDRIPEDSSEVIVLKEMSGQFYHYHIDTGQMGPIQLTASYREAQVGFGFLAYKKDGSVQEWIVPGQNGRTVQESPFDVADVDSIMLAIVNATRFGEAEITYNLSVLSIPEQITLEQNYPNPFGGSASQAQTTIVFTVPETEHVEITVYDVMGRKVKTIFNETVEPGFHHIAFDAAMLSTGVYLYRLRTPNVHKTGKMTLIR